MSTITNHQRNANQNYVQLYLTKIRVAITKGDKIHRSKNIRSLQGH